MQNTLLKKEFINAEDGCFKIAETRVSITDINPALLFDNMTKYKKNLIADVRKILETTNQIKEACDKYNEAIQDMVDAKVELGLEYDVIETVSYESLVEEVLNPKEETAE